jgi:hypothetical protein
MPLNRNRRYTDDEVSQILRIALDDGGAHGATRDGLSLDELVDVAGETGIDAASIRQAAERLDSVEVQSRGPGLFGVRGFTEMERTVEGEITDDTWDDVVQEVRSSFGVSGGETQALGKTREWQYGSELTRLHMSFKPENGRTKICSRFSAYAVPFMAYFMPTLIGAALIFKKIGPAVGSSYGWSGPLTVGFGFLLLLGMWAVIRTLLASWYKNSVRQMKSALDRAENEIGSEAVSAPVVTHHATEEEIVSRVSQAE